MTNFSDLKERVIDVGLCNGCGTCVGVCPVNAIRINYESDEPEPILVGNCIDCGLCYEVCTGHEVIYHEIEERIFGRTRKGKLENDIGVYMNCLMARAAKKDIRDNSSSGGLATALVIYALEKKIIDGVIFAGHQKNSWKFEPLIATTTEQFIRSKAKTALVMVPVNSVLRKATQELNLRKLCIIGLPCHIQGIRKIQLNERLKNISQRIVLTIGLFCASNYYLKGTEHLILEFSNVNSLNDVEQVDYRGGEWPGYLVVKTKKGEQLKVSSKHEYTWHFLGPSYKRDFCLMCIDFSSELADISLGDVFIPLEDDPRWNAVLIRSKIGEELIKGAVKEGYIEIREYNPEMITSSGLGWEAKRHANAYRLIQRKRFKWPTPNYGYIPDIKPKKRKLYFPK